MNQKGISPEILKKFLEGRCTSEEAYQVEEWYFKLKMGDERLVENKFDQTQHLKKVQDVIRRKTGNNSSTAFQADHPRPSFTIKKYLVAASLLFLLTCGGFLYFYQTPEDTTSQALTATHSTSIVNTENQIVKYHLPDGSIVWLNPDAVLKYSPEGFSKHNRNVTISGEAFFEVTKDPSHPFQVKANTLIVKVLGTSFNVKAYPSEQQYEVSVVTGKVDVSEDSPSGAKHVTLLPEQKAVYEVASGNLSSSDVTPKNEKLESWQPTSIAFQDESLLEVTRRLQDKYDFSIQLANEDLQHCLVTATFEKNRLPEILETITQILNASYKMSEHTITISGEGCSPLE